jgi:hypothetical protein
MIFDVRELHTFAEPVTEDALKKNQYISLSVLGPKGTSLD